MSVEIFYEVTGDHVDAGTKCSSVTNGPVSVSDIKNCFAYEGEYLFRVKVPGSVIGFNSLEYTWIDLVDNDCDVYLNLSSQKVFIEVRALLISAPEVDEYVLETQNAEYMNEVEHRLRQLQQTSAPKTDGQKSSIAAAFTSGGGSSFLRHVVQTASQGVQELSQNKDVNASVQAVGKSMFGLWNSVKSAATTAATIVANAVTGAVPSSIAAGNLRNICSDISTTYNNSNPQHVVLLTELWNVTFTALQPSARYPPRFERESLKWKEILGFQTANPIADLKTSGLLGLRCLAYMIDRYSVQSARMITKNQVNTKTNYPFALVGVNISLLLADVLAVREERFAGLVTGYWEIFEHPCAFFELFCVCFFFMDSIWTKRGATRADFAKIIADTRIFLESSLAGPTTASGVSKGQPPRSIQQFQRAAEDHGYTPPPVPPTSST